MVVLYEPPELPTKAEAAEELTLAEDEDYVVDWQYRGITIGFSICSGAYLLINSL